MSRIARGIWAAWLVFTLVPLVVLVLQSLGSRWFFPELVPQAWSLRGWRYALEPSSQVARAAGYSLLVAGGATLLSLLVGYPMGRALGLHRFRGQGLVRSLVMLPILVPPISYALGLHLVFLRLRLADSLMGLVLVHMVPCLPYMVMMLYSQFSNFQVEFEHQARNLGAGTLQILLRVTLPAIRPGLYAGILLSLLVSWSQYLLNLLIGGGRVPNLPQLVFAFAWGSDPLMSATMAMIFGLPPLLALWVLGRLDRDPVPVRWQP